MSTPTPSVSPPDRPVDGLAGRPGGVSPGCAVCGSLGCPHRRCGAYQRTAGRCLACCRPELHEGPHCGHEHVTGTPGVLGRHGGTCDGTRGEPFTTDLLSPTERYYRDRPPIRRSTP